MADVNNVAEAIEKIGVAFEEYKRTNDARLEAVKKDASTSDIEAKLAKIDADLDQLTSVKAQIESLETKLARPNGAREKGDETPAQAEYKAAFFDWMRNPKDIGKSQTLQALEAKTTSVLTSSNSAGGYALPEFIERTIARLGADISPIRSIATVRQVSTPDYKELFDTGGAAFEWIGEGDTRNQTNVPVLAEVAPTFGMASAKPQASEESLDDLFFNVEQWLIDAVVEAFAVGEGAAFISGNGTKKPKGFLAGETPVTTADSSRAFGTLQYVASGQASALPTSADTFLDLIYSTRVRYRANSRWLTSKAVVAALRKYKDKEDNYLWQPALAMGEPSSFLGFPITEAEDMPAVAANAFPLAFGDFREGYLICDRVGMRITRDEITTPGYVKFYCRRRTGGILRNSQAIKLLKIAAS